MKCKIYGQIFLLVKDQISVFNKLNAEVETLIELYLEFHS